MSCAGRRGFTSQIHYLSARKAAHNHRISGSTDVDMDDLTMNRYCVWAGRKYINGQVLYALPFKYIDAANYLSYHLKCSGRSGEEEKRMRDVAMGRADCSDGGEGVCMATTGKRPRGVNAEKRAAHKEKGYVEVAEILER